MKERREIVEARGDRGMSRAERLLVDLQHALGERSRPDRLQHVAASALDFLFEQCGAQVVNEADGARMKPFKAPAEHEPVLGRTTTLALIVVGQDAIGAPLDAEHVHRPELVARFSGAAQAELLKAPHLKAIIAYYITRVKEQAPAAECAVLINKADRGPDESVLGLAALLSAARVGVDDPPRETARLHIQTRAMITMSKTTRTAQASARRAAISRRDLMRSASATAATAALSRFPAALGGNGAALALRAARAVPDGIRLRRREEFDGDLRGPAVLAVVVALMPAVVPGASWVSDAVGILGGFAVGLPVALTRPL